MRKRSDLILLCIFLSFITGCSTDTRNEMEEVEIVDSVSSLVNSSEGEDIVDSLSEDTVPEEAFRVPDFLYGYLDNGTYDQPIRISNLENVDEIRISAQNTLDFPESSVVAVITNKWGDSSKLLERNDEETKMLFQVLQNIGIKQEKNARNLKDGEQDAEISVVTVMANGKYSLIRLRSFKDDVNEISIDQENESETMIFFAHSEELHHILREICDVKEGNIQVIDDADNIKYLSNNEWIELTDHEIRQFRLLVDTADVIPNYSTGCPFELKLIIESDENQYVSAYATDGCGIIIIEDTTYQLKEENRQVIEEIFKNVSWH